MNVSFFCICDGKILGCTLDLISLLFHYCLRVPIMLLKKKNQGPTTLSLLSLTLLIHVDMGGIRAYNKAFLYVTGYL